MTEENKSIYYKDMYVAFLDILGFKDMMDYSSCNDIYSIFKQIEETELKNAIQFVNQPEKNYPLDSVKKYIMSDSIVMYIEAKKKNALNALVKQCTLMAMRLLTRKDKPILIRGGISRGEFYRNQSIAFGPALVNAYYMENYTKMPRIWIDSNIISEYQKDGSEDGFIYEEDDEYYVSFYSFVGRDVIDNVIEKVEFEKCSQSDKGRIEKYQYVEEKLLEKVRRSIAWSPK